MQSQNETASTSQAAGQSATQTHPQPQPPQVIVEPYKLSEIFSIIPEFDGNQISLNTFLNSCSTSFDMAMGNQKILLTIHIKNKLKGRAAELINSRNPTSWGEIRQLLESHFGDTRDLTALIQDLQRMRQLSGESPMTFISRLQTHEAKMHASVHKQHMTAGQKQAQITLTESMVLNTLLTGLEPKLGHVIRASDPRDMLTAIARVRRELQLNYFENQKFGNRNPINNVNPPIRKPNLPQSSKQCSFCKRAGHTYNECRQRQQNFQNFNVGPRPNFYQNPQSNFQQNSQPNFQQQRPFPPQNNFRQNGPQVRPPVIVQNPNYNGQRPPVIHQNPNYRSNHPNQNNRRTFHLNDQQEHAEYDPNYYTVNNFEDPYQNYYPANSSNYDDSYTTNDTYYEDYYTANGSYENIDYSQNEQTPQTPPVYNQDFQSGPPIQPEPPNSETQDPSVSDLQTQIANMNLDNFDPNLNFPENRFA